MRFTRLKIAGFKSFADPTELRIEEGLTGIVGPNGCGKSNLVEALRWVMGEHAPSTLRSKAMDDVIFAGTDRRPARNIAEVGLLIDNRERDAPPEFNDCDDIEILRRIERGIGSLYRINGREVRAKDVQLFFADVATGARSPSLIGQGRIAELIQAKPADRRIVLEEAAGIAGLYGRRREAEQKLAGAERNLERVEEVIADLAARIAQLKREARRAERYRKLSARIRTLEALLLWCRLRDAQTAGRRAEERLKSSDENLAGAARELAQAEQASLAAEEAIAPLRQQAEAARAAANRLLLERRSLEEERARLARQAEELARQRQRLAEDVAHERARLEDARESLARIAADRAKLTEREPVLTQERAAAESARNTARAQLEDAQAARDEAARRLAEARGRRAGLESDMLAIRRRLDAIEEDLRECDLEAQESVLATHRQEIATSRSGLEEIVAALAALEEEIATATADLTDATAARETEEEKLATCRAQRVALESERDALAASLTRGRKGGGELLAFPVPDGLEAAVASALSDLVRLPLAMEEEGEKGGFGDSLVLRTLSPFATAMLPSWPAALTPLATLLPEAPAAVRRRLQTVALWEGEEDPDELRALHERLMPGQIVVTRSGIVLRADGVCGRPSESAEEARLLAARNRHRKLAEAVAAAREKETEQAALLAASQEHEDKARQALATLQNRRRELEGRREASATALAKAEREVAATEARLAAERSRLAALAEEREQLTERLAALEREHAALADTASGEATLRQAEEAVAKARDRFDAADGRLRMLLREADDLANRRETLAREETAWDKRRDSATRRLHDLEKRAAELAEQEAAISRRPQEIAKRLEELDSLLDQAERHAQEADNKVQAAENTRREAQGVLKAAQEAMAAAREERARAEADAEHAAQRLAEVVHEIEERFSLSAAAFKERMAGREEELPDDVAELESALTDARAARERLGAVNLRAEIEMKELAEQHEHLVHEKADLEAAIQRLRQGIGNLNREGRVRLLEAFETVNRHFSDLFARLFEGGHARLELVESDDPLEAGLEIMARPPGKKLQSLALLSGGEQTLTALALVFAVFLTNPAPICVLDEVDAPLDEANVERFCDLLDEMVRRTGTRFLVVTHNELTMARMHRLYGVTMREKGVSELVSVDLERAERLLAAE